MKKYLIYILSIISLCLFFPTKIFASSTDFQIDSDTNISYTTGNDYVSVKTQYTRTVKNNAYYYPASGEKVFNIPDLPDTTSAQIATERKYKLDSLKVTDIYGNTIKYTVEQQKDGEGIYVKVTNYKQTTASSPYAIQITYNTHDYVSKVVNFVTIQAPALPTDITFQQTDADTNTVTDYNYGLSITTDSSIAPLAKVYPTTYTKSEKSGLTTYTFAQEDRVGNSPYMEFGTSVTYKFALTYTTPKTDTFLPTSISNTLKALSTNIFEISLPREFDETNQKVYFTNVTPTPSDIYQDSEGNIIASFEVPANEISSITIEGYIVVNQNTLTNQKDIDINWDDYKKEIASTSYLQSYLTATKYWQTGDSVIQTAASALLENQTTVMGIIKADYAYVGSKLTYDQNKANSENERIGAVAALQGGASVCMEYADSMIAILRAQGIPARAALGYASLEETEQAQVRHEWVQAWIPNYGWLSIDPTYESNNMSIGQSMDKVLWEVFNNDSLSNIKVYSADNVNILNTEGYNINIYGVDSSNIDFSKLKTYTDLVPNKGYASVKDIPSTSSYSFISWLNTFLKTTTVGKSLIITGPIILVVIILSIVLFIIKGVKTRIKKKNNPNTVINNRHEIPRSISGMRFK